MELLVHMLSNTMVQALSGKPVPCLPHPCARCASPSQTYKARKSVNAASLLNQETRRTIPVHTLLYVSGHSELRVVSTAVL
eukprot:1952678-Amphidinium_carterae.1